MPTGIVLQVQKGQKDAKDLIRIAIIAESKPRGFDATLASAYLNDQHIMLIESIARGPEFISLARGNAKYAKKLREQFKTVMDKIKRSVS